MVFDYDGNLWFATGGFRIYPQRQQQGVIGYIARSAIDAILNGEQTDLSKAVFVYELTPGEGAENGIAASKDGAVVLTNQNCYLLRAEEGVDVVWCTPYESAGAKIILSHFALQCNFNFIYPHILSIFIILTIHIKIHTIPFLLCQYEIHTIQFRFPFTIVAFT